MSNSPFRPGYSRMPLVFGGHESTIRDFENVFENYDIGENQSVLISGLRGAGKTSMLGTLGDLAEKFGWLTIREDAGAGSQAALTVAETSCGVAGAVHPSRS
jgi:ABC-type transport system involved in cytochrome c biogenesis ATPase subunit